MQVKVSAGRRTRRTRTVDALTAAGVPPTVGYDLAFGDPFEEHFYRQVYEAKLTEVTFASWPCEAQLEDVGTVLLHGEGVGVYQLDGGLFALVKIKHGWCHVHVAGATRQEVSGVAASFQALYPPLYRQAEPGGLTTIPVTFWTYTPHGPSSRLRMIEGAEWAGISRNYPMGVRAGLERLLGDTFEPGKDGQLILWQGPPGSGKSWCLRALAHEWREWAEFSYITDPDRFFGDHPDYMIDVLLHESYEEIVAETGELVTSADPGGKWRVLILEDTGELLAADAKEQTGQGLSRLLNVVDGMIGQGLRVLVLVTTNDELGELHPAVRRPGRCASQIEFGPLSGEEAAAWLGVDEAEPMTLAELYASQPADPRAEIARVAAEHQDEAEGYGETAWNAKTRTVLYVCGDWTDPDPIEADFLALDGVDHFGHEAEALPDGWWDAKVVYPDPAPAWVTEPPVTHAGVNAEQAMQETLALARSPLPPLPTSETERQLVASLPALIDANIALAQELAVERAALREEREGGTSGEQA